MKKEELKTIADKIVLPEDMDQRLKTKLLKDINKSSRIPIWNKYAVTAAIALCAVLAFSGVTIAKSDFLRNWLSELDTNSKNAEKYIESNTAASDSDWLSVKDVYLDGTKLVFGLQLQENATVLPVDISDHAYVNGIDCLGDSFQCIGDGSYECVIDLSFRNDATQTTQSMIQDALSKETIPVKITLYCQGDTTTDRKDFEFSIPSKNMQLTAVTEGDAIPIMEKDENGTETQIGTVTGTFTVAPSTIKMRLHYEFTGEHAKENREKYADDRLLYNVIDDNGNTMDFFEVAKNVVFENYTDQEGLSSIDIVAELNKYDTNMKTITFYPVTIDYYTEGEWEGKYIPGSEVPHEERAITFQLQQ